MQKRVNRASRSEKARSTGPSLTYSCSHYSSTVRLHSGSPRRPNEITKTRARALVVVFVFVVVVVVWPNMMMSAQAGQRQRSKQVPTYFPIKFWRPRTSDSNLGLLFCCQQAQTKLGPARVVKKEASSWIHELRHAQAACKLTHESSTRRANANLSNKQWAKTCFWARFHHVSGIVFSWLYFYPASLAGPAQAQRALSLWPAQLEPLQFIRLSPSLVDPSNWMLL